MPQIPGIAGPASFGRRADAGDFGGAEAQAQGQRGAAVGQLGEVATQTAVINDRIKKAADQMKIGRQAAEISAQLDRARFDLQADPDIDTHEERFGKISDELLKKAREGLDPALGAQLEDRAFPAMAHSKLEVSSDVRTRRIGNADADRKQMLQLNSDLSAQTPDPIRRGQIRGQTAGMLDHALASGLIDQAAHDASLREFDRNVSLSDLRRMTREHPEAVFKRLGDPADPIAAGFDAAEREQFRTQALTEHEQQLREARETARAARIDQDRIEKDAGDAAAKNLDDLLAKGDVAGAQAELRRARAVLSPEQYGHFTDQMSGRGAAKKTVPAVYNDFSAKMANGEPIADEVAAAYYAGTLTQDDRNQLIKDSEDRRFGDAEKFLSTSVHQSDFAGDFNSTRQVAGAEALRSFRAWKAENPKASAPDALEHARALLRSIGIKDGATLLRPSDARLPDGKVDVLSQGQALMDRAARGEIDQGTLNSELKRLDDLEKAQQLSGSQK